MFCSFFLLQFSFSFYLLSSFKRNYFIIIYLVSVTRQCFSLVSCVQNSWLGHVQKKKKYLEQFAKVITFALIVSTCIYLVSHGS